MSRYLPLVVTLVVVAVNAAANIVPINGVQTGELSARYPTGFTPAGWVFSIWSLIYIGLLAYSVYALRVREGAAERIARILPAYVASGVGNALWIFMWHYELIAASLACMLLILGSLIVAYVRLYATPPRSTTERLCVDFPFSLYLGWITTATLANLAAWFYDLQTWPFGLAMEEWALLTVVTAAAIYTAVGVRTGDAIYTLVFAWASLGIVQQTLPISAPVRLAAAAGCAVAAVVTAVSLVGAGRGRRGRGQRAAGW
ncbi:MAG: tryptophan-rich sensory protein [Gammaproteobacteria bacterium]|nr:tryptophan-rich sensory protein [Gammaproteobacteria bacterium]